MAKAAKRKEHKDSVQYVGTAMPKKSFGFLYILVMVVVTFLGVVFGEAWTISSHNEISYFQGMSYYIGHPYAFEFGWQLVAVVLMAWLLGGLMCIYIWASPKKFANGIEQGSEDWADINDITKRLTDTEPQLNRILTENVKVSIDAKVTDLNNNTLIIGSPGSRKSHGLIRPNLLNCVGSMVVTDPKGELLRTTGNYLKSHGYEIKVLNLIKMNESDYYNPFDFLRSADDIPKLLTVFFENTTDPSASKGDPFWEKAEMMLDQAVMTYLYMETKNPSFNDVVDIINQIEIKTDQRNNIQPYDLKNKFDALRADHPARLLFNKAMVGAADTVRSIVITAQARLNLFSNKKLCKMMSSNSFDFKRMGMEQKTAFFMVIPDVDKTYNSIAAMAYNQLIQELFEAADAQEDGRLKIPVTMWLDEFANISMPKDFLTYLATMRGRLISACMVIQGLSQLKGKYKDDWETMTNCCDTLMFLGGSSLETNKWLSEEMGKRTYDKYTQGRTYGSHGNSSRNQDVYGRALMEPSELRRLPRSKAIVIINGEYPIYDDKYLTHLKPEFKEAKSLGAYRHILSKEEKIETKKRANEASEYSKLYNVGKDIFEDLQEENAVLSNAEKEALEYYCKKAGIQMVNVSMPASEPTDRLDELLKQYFDKYNAEQRALIREAVIEGVDAAALAKAITPDCSMKKLSMLIKLCISNAKNKMSHGETDKNETEA